MGMGIGMGMGMGMEAGPGAGAGAGAGGLAVHQFSLGPCTDSTDRALLIPLHSSLDSLWERKREYFHNRVCKNN